MRVSFGEEGISADDPAGGGTGDGEDAEVTHRATIAYPLAFGLHRQIADRHVRAAGASWDALPEVVAAHLLDWASERDLVRFARASGATARTSAAALAARAPSSTGRAMGLSATADWVRGTRLLRGESQPCRRRLLLRHHQRVSQVRLVGCGLVLITVAGRSHVHRLGRDGRRRGDEWLLPCVLGGDDKAAAHQVSAGGTQVLLAVSATSHASVATVSTFDLDLGSPGASLRPLGVASERTGPIVALDVAPSIAPRRGCSCCSCRSCFSCDERPCSDVPLRREGCRAGCGLVVVTATSLRHGKRTVIKLRCSVSLCPLARPLEVEGGRPFAGCAVWGCGLAVAGADPELALSVWRPTLDAALDAAEHACWTKSPVGAAWPRRELGDLEVRCSGDGASRGEQRQLLLVWSRQAACPHVSVWQSGDCATPLCAMRLALNSSGEFLTSHVASDAHKMRSMSAGAGVTVLAGAVAGELCLLLTSDGCLRAWPLDAPHKPAGSVSPHTLPEPFGLPLVLLRLRWTLRDDCQLTVRAGAVDVVLHGTHSLPSHQLHAPTLPHLSTVTSPTPAAGASELAGSLADHTAVAAAAEWRAYDPGMWEWLSIGRTGSTMGSAHPPALACWCGLPAARLPVDTLRGRQVHVSCPRAASRDGGALLADPSSVPPTSSRQKRGCGMSLYACEALLQPP